MPQFADLNSAPNGLGAGLLSCLDAPDPIGMFRTLSPLPKLAQELFDRKVVTVGLDRLAVVRTIIEAGLTVNLPNWLGIMSIYWESRGRSGRAQTTMVPKARGERQMPNLSPHNLPIPCTWDDFSLNIRVLAAAQRTGAPLETGMVADATRNVNETIEDTFINGGVTVEGMTTPGLLGSPFLSPFTDTQSWSSVDHSGEDIVKDIELLVAKAEANRRFGPYVLFIPTAYNLKINLEDYKAFSSDTIYTRLSTMTFGQGNLKIVVADQLPADTVVLVQLTDEIVDVIIGQQPTVISWSDGPGFERFFIVLACIVPRIKQDFNEKMGIIIGTPSGVLA